MNQARSTQIQFSAGCHLRSAAAQLVKAAKESGEARGMFNDIELRATADTTSTEIEQYFDRETKARSEAYRNSAAGIADAADRKRRRADAQAMHDGLMRKLTDLDFSDDVAVLAWVCAMQDPTDSVGVIVRRDTIVQAFEAKGFEAGANCGFKYRDGDRDNMFRYLVGQALDGLKRGPAINPIIHKFADNWRKLFDVKAGP